MVGIRGRPTASSGASLAAVRRCARVDHGGVPQCGALSAADRALRQASEEFATFATFAGDTRAVPAAIRCGSHEGPVWAGSVTGCDRLSSSNDASQSADSPCGLGALHKMLAPQVAGHLHSDVYSHFRRETCSNKSI
jgi:hypothetical protein